MRVRLICFVHELLNDSTENWTNWQQLFCCSQIYATVAGLVINVFITGYVTFALGCYMVCCSIASLAVGWYIWVVLIYIHSRLTAVPTPSKLNTQRPGVSLRRSFLHAAVWKVCTFCICLLNHCYTSVVWIINFVGLFFLL